MPMAEVLPYTLSLHAKPIYPARSLLNLLRMGHCAPTVMQTALQITHNEQAWLVKLTAGLPGGIGNTQGECGGVTSPLIVLGLRHGLDEMQDGLPALFDHGHAYEQRFQAKNAAIFCKEIQGKGCLGAVCQAPGLLAETQATDNRAAIPVERRAAYARLYAHFQEQDFHCARAVFQHLRSIIPVTRPLHQAVSAFIGGMLFQGFTCSAFAAGVMAIGLQTGQIENSYPRVLRMLTKGIDIADERANHFHRTINAGQRLAEWFAGEFGSLQCCAITGCDFANAGGATQYIAGNGLAACREIACATAARVEGILAEGD
ncbi:MAG: C-GCAxxG-C-C family (seleno)protein [Chloroflexota bacterium]